MNVEKCFQNLGTRRLYHPTISGYRSKGNEIPHTFTDQYKSLWSGVGTGNLLLLPGLTPGGTGSNATDNANVAAQALNGPESSMSLVRKRAGLI